MPVIIFAFSRQRCDDYANMLTSIDLTNRLEKFQIHKFFLKAVRRLAEHDRQLPQIRRVIELCKRGIAIHNAGILPLLKVMIADSKTPNLA